MNVRILLVAVLALGACTDDTGILIEVHGEQIEAQVVRLETMVIVDEGAGVPDGAAWGAAERVDATVEGLDLRTEPYTVMLRPDGAGNDATVWVAAMGYDGQGVLVAFGQLDAPISFTSDLVKRVAIHLHPATENAAGCVVKDGQVLVRNTDDCDGDQAPYTEDCNDLDPEIVADLDGDSAVCWDDCDPGNGEIFPGQIEACNGHDDDCDPATAPPPLLCVDVIREAKQIISCGIGQRVCADDVPGTEDYGACVTSPVDPVANAETCDRWASCLESGEPDCLIDAEVHCKLGVADVGVGCLPAIGRLGDLTAADACNWTLLGGTLQGGWELGLRPRGTTSTLTSFVDVCDAELVVTSMPESRDPQVFLLASDDGLVTTMFSVLIDPEATGCSADQESELECSVVGP